MVIVEMPQRMKLGDFIRNHHWDDVSVVETGLFFVALHTAVCRHWNQKRDDGETEYYEHLLVVADSLHRLGFDIEVQIAGLLHDVMEDCSMSREEIKKTFGIRIADIVASLSEDKDGPDSYLDQLFEGTKMHFEVIIVKLVDRWHNLVTIYGFRNQARQIRYLEETIGPLYDLFCRCRKLIPEKHLFDYNQLVSTVFSLASSTLDQIGKKTA